ncbi:MAG: hypothetical protein M9890_12725 [Thermomicrobiales bacterium]|nr:hypothetical protein [Thermomicrobiales bacterium]
MPRVPDLPPSLDTAITQLGQDASLSSELGALRVLLRRLLVAMDDEEGDERRLVQSATAVVNAIVRIIQAQSRGGAEHGVVDAEVLRALAEVGLDEEGGDPCMT